MRRAVAAFLLPLLAGACGSAVAGAPPPSTAPIVAAAPASTPTTTYALPQPMILPADDYFDEPLVEIGRITVPALGLDDTLRTGVSLHTIDLGPSHWPGSARPGELGNVVIAGHRVTHSRPFRHLDRLAAGDTLTFAVESGTYIYEFVGSEIVTPDRVEILTQQPAYTATLFACHPPGSARERIVAYFRLAGAPAPGQPDPASLPDVTFPLPSA